MISKDGLFALEVITDGKRRREYQQGDEVFVLGSTGQPYLLRVGNYSNRRSVAVINAEGLCIVDGVELGDQGVGYIIEPNQELEISSWHLRQQDVAPLVFGELPHAFLQLMDEPTNEGAIEATFFYEADDTSSIDHDLIPVAIATIIIHGRGWGSKDTQTKKWEEFSREGTSVSYLEINYKSANELRGMDVLD